MNTEQIKKDIKKALKGLPIPNNLKEDAMQEGFIAYLDGKNIKSHVSTWLKNEYNFRTKLGLNDCDPAIRDIAIEDPANNNRRIMNADIEYIKPVVVDGEMVTYEKI